MREALANALCHRDYSYSGGSVSFAIYNDRLEIWNYGLLPPGVSVERLGQLNRSVPRNRRIANVLYYHKIFESWGRGVQMIIDECVKAGHPAPVYAQEAGGTSLILKSYQTIGVNSELPIEKAGQSTEIQKFIDVIQLTPLQQIMIVLLKEQGPLSTQELLTLVENPPTERWLRKQLNYLRKLGLVEAKGQTTSRKWFSIP